MTHCLQIEFVARADQIGDSLWAACFPPPYEGRFWYQALEESHLEDQFLFRYGLIRSNGQPIGIAPCFVHDVPIALVAPRPIALGLEFLSKFWPRIGYQRTFFIGSPCSDEGTIGILPAPVGGLGEATYNAIAQAPPVGGLAEAARTAIARAAQSEARKLRAPLTVFKDFPPTTFTTASLPPGFFPILSYPGTLLPLPPPDAAAYFRSLSHLHRHNFLKKLRRSKELLPLTTAVIQHPNDAELDEILALFQQTYERGKTKFERLGRPFFESIRGREPVHFILQRDSAGALVAFMLVFHLGDRVINKFIGLDYLRAGKTYLYFRLFEAALDFAYARGARELQSGQTGYRAKRDLGHRLVPLTNFVRHQNPLINALYRAIGTRVTWASLDSDLKSRPD